MSGRFMVSGASGAGIAGGGGKGSREDGGLTWPLALLSGHDGHPGQPHALRSLRRLLNRGGMT
jgi:hypothetical protein